MPRMAAMEHGLTFYGLLFCECADQKAGRPRKYKGLWFSSVND